MARFASISPAPETAHGKTQGIYDIIGELPLNLPVPQDGFLLPKAAATTAEDSRRRVNPGPLNQFS